jgi:hypothetical protein
LIFSLLVNSAYAQELEPRAYSNIPVGLNFFAAGYGYSVGGILFDPSVPLDNAHIRIHGSVLGYARSIKLGRMSGKVDVILPYVWLSGTADFQGDPVSRVVNGFGDPRLSMTVNFVGAPAMALSEFRDYRQNLIIGGSLKVFMPLSQYDPERLVNVGTNRFAFKPELGISKTLGPLFLELAASVTFFTVNNDFVDGWERSQEPLGALQGHAVYNFTRAIWVALDGTYYWGGRTTIEGVRMDDLQRNTRLGITFSLPLSLRQSIKLYFSTGVSTRTGSDYDAVGLVWQYMWGKGLPRKQ